MRTVLSFCGCVIALGFATTSLAQTWPAGVTPVRGKVVSVSGDVVMIKSASGPVKIHLAKTLKVYTRTHSDLSHVTSKTFVGVTSIKQPDGSERATEIHIFPEALRGTGEGSYLMNTAQPAGVPRSRMTNGTVSGVGKVSARRPRMTNGTVTAKSGSSTLLVQYGSGLETIRIPANVTVTAMTPTTAKLKPGESVFALAKKQANGSLTTNSVIAVGK